MKSACIHRWMPKPSLMDAQSRHLISKSQTTLPTTRIQASPSITVTTELQSLLDLPIKKGALLDQFGVLHNGQTPYNGAIEAVQYLLDQGTKILIISNSSRRSHGALKNLEKMGFPTAQFHGVITSGEVTRQNLLTRPTPFWTARKRCLHLTWSDRGAISIEGLGIDVTTDPSEADCILAHGTEAVGTHVRGEGALPRSLDELKDIVLECVRIAKSKNMPPIPMIVANPDIVTVQGSELRVMPGTIARWYADAGGEVHLMGKPSEAMYRVALSMLDLPAEEVIMIGDSIEHDVAGANSVGVESLFIAGGIHASELFEGENPAVNAGMVGQLCERHGIKDAPRYTLPYFSI